MPLVLGKRNDVAAKEKVDRSGLLAEDWALMAVDNTWRDCHFAAEELAATTRKLDRLTALLDDPDLAVIHPADDPDRLDAQAKRAELWRLRDLQRRDVRRYAKRTAERAGELPSDDLRAWFAELLMKLWADSPALSFVRLDPGLPRLDFWRAVLALPTTTEELPCPF